MNWNLLAKIVWWILMHIVLIKPPRTLQDPRQSELRLRPMTDKDRDQLRHLANLYSLSIHSTDDHNAPILTKTRYISYYYTILCRHYTIGLTFWKPAWTII